MTVPILVAIFAVLALVLFVRASRAFFWESYARGVLDIVLGIVLALAAVCTALVGAALATYQRVTAEEHVAQVEIERKGDHYNVMLTMPGPKFQAFEVRGDDFQVDARVLKWKGIAYLLGFDTIYRLDRLSGRYRNIEDEKTKPRTVYALNPPDRIDLWELARNAMEVLPGIDAIYGSSTYVPMVAAGTYEVKISPTGLFVRPTNPAAKKAVGSWK
jgi:hypothetical protein